MQDLYRRLNVTFLTSESDTIVAYEERGQHAKGPSSSYESGMQMLQGLGRVQQVEALHGTHCDMTMDPFTPKFRKYILPTF